MNFKRGDLLSLSIVALLLLLLAIFFTLAPHTEEPSLTQAVVEGTTLEAQEVIDQTTVAITLTTKVPSFVTVHDLFSLNAPGAIIGTSGLIAPGDHQTIKIRINKAFDKNYDYVVLVEKDNGDGMYEPGIDLPIMSNGEVVKAKFAGDNGAP